MSNTEPKDPKLAAVELDKAHTDAAIAKLELKLKAEDLKRKKEDRKHQAWLNLNSKATEVYNEALENFHFGVVRITDGIYDDVVQQARQELRTLAELKPGEPIRLELNSPGGSILDGLDLFDEIRRVSDSGCLVTTVVTGYAASMAGVLIQAGDLRVIGARSYLHLHEGSTWVAGSASSVRQGSKFLDTLTEQMAEIYASRTDKITAKEILAKIEGKEWWLNATEALEIGFVDEIA